MKPYYTDSHCTIYHGDCREILPELPKVDLVLTDPPYGLGTRMQGGTWGAQDHNSGFLKWDLNPVKWGLLWELICLGKEAIVWGGNYYPMPPSRCWLSWNKINSVPTMADFEMAWTNLDKPCKSLDHIVGRAEYGHPTQKPIKLIKWCINQADGSDFERPKVLTILDPFMGSGTTLRAAKDLNRKAIGVEMEEKYCEIAVKRLQQEVMQF